MAKKKIKLACFDIRPIEKKLTKPFNIFSDFSATMANAKKLNKRCRTLSDISVSGEKEFISNTSMDRTGIFCTFLHLKSGGAIHITNSLLEGNGFSI